MDPQHCLYVPTYVTCNIGPDMLKLKLNNAPKLFCKTTGTVCMVPYPVQLPVLTRSIEVLRRSLRCQGKNYILTQLDRNTNFSLNFRHDFSLFFPFNIIRNFYSWTFFSVMLSALWWFSTYSSWVGTILLTLRLYFTCFSGANLMLDFKIK